MVNKEIRLNVISQQLGHSNVGTTSTYLQRLSPEVVIQTMQRREWDF